MRVLAVSAHPDDETLGCGATLLKHRDAGDTLAWVISSRRALPRFAESATSLQQRQISAVSATYGFSEVVQLGLPDAELDMVPFADVVNGLDAAIASIRPDVVYVVHAGDVHSDHGVVHAATMSVLKGFRMQLLGVRRVLAFETLSSTDAAVQDHRHVFLPTVFNDVSGYVDRKCAIMEQYASELQGDQLPRTISAITALARYRGATIGVEHAEAFQLLRELA